MQQKYPILVFLCLTLVSGCMSSSKIAQEDITATPLKTFKSSEPSSTATAVPVVSNTPNSKFIPKAHDLIFVEFFAGT